ncbi:hypothetical protein CONPUDRAFT_124605 [Coniophora puteana RWD-64-598 SS2]|uniref:Tetraspanin Tsp2 family n=1 Tax=Coniophora puteana (strain RWD-64-598) TaxID=741705 RepID=A0A5M3MSH1_CONPW|nr:uncharacterized protein CONPUDRAFT_124605 [Coniophora puteana RWD-64-598 SS2]EIW81481.1 hypothetical protein CONPUDRAFT_124605 [Coniophora puteana RWD-64-598 SS2]
MHSNAELANSKEGDGEMIERVDAARANIHRSVSARSRTGVRQDMYIPPHMPNLSPMPEEDVHVPRLPTPGFPRSGATTPHSASKASVRSTGSSGPPARDARVSVRHSVSAASIRSGRSVDSGKQSLISTVGIGRKFTHKWPRPLSVPVPNAPALGESGRVGKLRIPALVLEDEDYVVEGTELKEQKKKARWTIHKWALFFSVIMVFGFGVWLFVDSMLTWFRTWQNADVVLVANRDILSLSTVAGTLLLFNAIIGGTGVLLNSRPFLAVYTVLLWPTFVSVCSVGYASYKRTVYSLSLKLNAAWSAEYTPAGRMAIQNALHCCGWFSPLHEAEGSKICYARSPLPGCKGHLLRFDRGWLMTQYISAFSLVPFVVIAIVIALLCSNHVTQRFGKGILPRQYWLRVEDVREEAQRIMKSGVLHPDEASDAKEKVSEATS